jgi:ABC-type molybdate transport system substrate-binding protein
MTKINKIKQRQLLTSLGIMAVCLGLSYAPVPGFERTIIVVSGTELQEPLQALAAKFEQQNPSMHLELKFQGSQDIVNNFIDQKNDFKPTILIPANGEILTELRDRFLASNNSEPFYNSPRPIVKTILVGIAQPERGKVLFPNGGFEWRRLEQAMQAGNWSAVGGSSSWGSFDFVTTDPTRSNSGQLTLSLWAQSKLGGTLTQANLSNSTIQSLFRLIKGSVYQPPRSTDVLLQEFITRGANDADVATVYESAAIYRWQQAATTQGKPYQIYYLNPTVETISTAAIIRPNVDAGTESAATKFLDFLTQPEQLAVFIQYGFRPVNNNIDLTTVPNSPWSKNIPGVQAKPTQKIIPPPDNSILADIQRLWERGN